MKTYPSIVYLIRHAEEPKPYSGPYLSVKGIRRASALPSLFGLPSFFSGPFQTPEFLFAASNSSESHRSVETLAPLSQELGRPIEAGFDDDEFKALARRLTSGPKYQGAVLLICWHRESIPGLARALGASKHDLPAATWAHDDYDSIWTLRFWPAGLDTISSESQGLDL